MAKTPDFKKPEGCCTAWELLRDYGISRLKVSRAVRSGKLNGFMLGTEEYVVLKWYVQMDELLEKFIAENKKIG